MNTPTPAGDTAPIMLENVSVFYGEVIGLSRVSLHIAPGITGVVGPNGSGKTTLMRVLTGLVDPSEGQVRVLGQSPFAHAGTRARLGFVPATECFYEEASGQRNLTLAFLARGHSVLDARRKAREALEVVGLAKVHDQEYSTWSRGMRQRLKLALALTADVDVVLLDEPFLGVDPPSRHGLRGLIQQLGEMGRTVLLSSHVLHEVEAVTDRVAVLANGRLLGSGHVRVLMSELRDRHPHTVRIDVTHPRALAGALVSRDEVLSVKVVDDATLEIVTTAPDRTYRELAAEMVRANCFATRVHSHDDSLEALFEHMTRAGAQRL